MIDSHCHLDVDAFAADRAAVLTRAAAGGVTGLLIPAIRPATWAALCALPAAHPGAPLALALGIHPQIVPALTAAERGLADDLEVALTAARTARVVAVGECGLDGGTADHDGQEAIFRAHIRAARSLALPLVIHVLRAHDVAPRILREERVHECGGVLHSYSGSPELVSIYLDLGLHVSFAGAVTWPQARKPRRSARRVPRDRLLAETDSPDQSPTSRRGARNEPAALAEVVAALADAHDVDVATMAAATTASARALFPLAAPWW